MQSREGEGEGGTNSEKRQRDGSVIGSQMKDCSKKAKHIEELQGKRASRTYTLARYPVKAEIKQAHYNFSQLQLPYTL